MWVVLGSLAMFALWQDFYRWLEVAMMNKLVLGLALGVRGVTFARAEQPRVGFPAHYVKTFTNYLSLDRVENPDQIIRLFAYPRVRSREARRHKFTGEFWMPQCTQSARANDLSAILPVPSSARFGRTRFCTLTSDLEPCSLLRISCCSALSKLEE
jgi:hypothetical protein